jgi:hypothetical protein
MRGEGKCGKIGDRDCVDSEVELGAGGSSRESALMLEKAPLPPRCCAFQLLGVAFETYVFSASWVLGGLGTCETDGVGPNP